MLGQSFPELQEALKGEKRTVDVNGLGKQVRLFSFSYVITFMWNMGNFQQP